MNRPTAPGFKHDLDGLTLEQLRRRRWIRTRGRAIALVIALVVIGLFATWIVYFSSAFALANVRVVGASTVPLAQIKAAAKAPIAKPLARVDLGTLAARVQAMPAISSARVERSWPNSVVITVVERRAVAVASTPTGLRNIDASGVLFGQLRERPAGLPLVIVAGSVDERGLREAAKVGASLPRDIARNVLSISVSSMDSIQLNLSGGRWVRWGSAVESITKAKVAAVLLRMRAVHIDVSVPSNPTSQ